MSILVAAPVIQAGDATGQIAESPISMTSDLGVLDTSGLSIKSAAALVTDDQGRRVYGKHSRDIKPIASVTKLMTAMVVLDADPPMDEPITILEVDRDTIRHSRSRLRTNMATLTRREMLTIALMSSENRAAAALGRTTFRGGTPAFVRAMNRKAQSLGMVDSHFADASGLNGANRSTAEDLVKMLQAAGRYPFIRQATTTTELTVYPYASGATLDYRNTNPLIRNANPDWDIGLSKTGYLNEAGRCLVMQARIGGRSFYIVLLDAFGKLTPVGDSNRLRKWLESELGVTRHTASGSGTGRG
jgi:D-alanyl-D-alanine endopeptidase (penicillin-binding protein 7)